MSFKCLGKLWTCHRFLDRWLTSIEITMQRWIRGWKSGKPWSQSAQRKTSAKN